MPNLYVAHGDDRAVDQVMKSMPAADQFQIAADLFRQLGDGSRIRIFWILCHCEACVTTISSMMQMSSPAVSHHLRQLRGTGLIVGRRDGKEVYYRVADNELARTLHQMIEHMVQIACPAEGDKR